MRRTLDLAEDLLAHQSRQSFRTLAEVHWPRRHHDPNSARRADHSVACKAWITAATVYASAPRPTRMVMLSISSSMTPAR